MVDFRLINEFIVKLMKHNKEPSAELNIENHDDIYFDIISPNGIVFELISEHKKRYYFNGELPVETIFNYVLPPFYWFLYKNRFVTMKNVVI